MTGTPESLTLPLGKMAKRVVAQHPLLNANSCTLSVADVCMMTDKQVEKRFAELRWSDNDSHPYCPHCGGLDVYTCKRPSGLTRYRCKGCRKDFSVTSGTIFAWHKKPLRVHLLAIVIVRNEVKGKSMIALRRDLRVQYKTAFVLSHKLREWRLLPNTEIFASRGLGPRVHGCPRN